jgi:predicted GIY-YIG superfamily endonuclease
MTAISPDQQQLSLRHNVQGTVYVLHFEPAYKHARHYVGWTEGDVVERLAVHLQGRGSPLIRAALAVLLAEVLNAGDGRSAAGGGVRSPAVVVAHER